MSTVSAVALIVKKADLDVIRPVRDSGKDQPELTMCNGPRGEKRPPDKIIGILVAITCLTMGDAAQAACRTAVDDYQLQRDARTLDRTPEQLEIMLDAGLLARAAAGFKSAVEELVCRGWTQSQIDEALRRKGHLHS